MVISFACSVLTVTLYLVINHFGVSFSSRISWILCMIPFQDKFMGPVVYGVNIYMETTLLEVKFITHSNTLPLQKGLTLTL